MQSSYFFSYAHCDARDGQRPSLVERFFDDLLAEVRALVPTASAFRDGRDIPLGVPFEREIVAQLRRVRAMISLCSPAYFASEFCGKEWALFAARARAPKPATLLPVVWIPVDAWPTAVSARQLNSNALPISYTERGLRFLTLRKDIARYRDDYLNAVHALAHALGLALKRRDLLSDVGLSAEVDQLTNPFAAEANAEGVGPCVQAPPAATSAADKVASDTNSHLTVRTEDPFVGSWARPQGTLRITREASGYGFVAHDEAGRVVLHGRGSAEGPNLVLRVGVGAPDSQVPLVLRLVGDALSSSVGESWQRLR